MSSILRLAFAFATLFVFTNAWSNVTDDKIYGVNLGNWFVFEPWMAENEWQNKMGGDPGNCHKTKHKTNCIRSEWDLVKAYPDDADERFQQHWKTWFTQDDVNKLVEYNINTVRIPLGFWIIEKLVDRNTEFYPRGGLPYLKRGLKLLHAAGIRVILTHHALPGVAAKKQMFAGRVTEDVQFYTPYNYGRALTWTAVMTTLAHLDPDFEAVFAIEAANEPISDASQTPGLQHFYGNFSQVVRATELSLGIRDKHTDMALVHLPALLNIHADGDLLESFKQLSTNDDITSPVRNAIQAAAKILPSLTSHPEMNIALQHEPLDRSALIVTFMDYQWQHNQGKAIKANGADAALGNQMYDDHHYFAYGGVDPNPDAYLRKVCTMDRVQQDAEVGQKSVVFGEWSLATSRGFNAEDWFLKKFADAQKHIYSKGAGWIFWNFKIEHSDLEGDVGRQWSYFDGVERGYLTKDPSKLHNPSVCDQYTHDGH